jgi:hypothetical protein
MVRKLGELPNFVVFNYKIESFENSSIFCFFLTVVHFIEISVLTF